MDRAFDLEERVQMLALEMNALIERRKRHEAAIRQTNAKIEALLQQFMQMVQAHENWRGCPFALLHLKDLIGAVSPRK